MDDFVEGAGQVTKTVHSIENTIVTVIFSLILISGLITVGYCLFYSSTDDVKCGRIDSFFNSNKTCVDLKNACNNLDDDQTCKDLNESPCFPAPLDSDDPNKAKCDKLTKACDNLGPDQTCASVKNLKCGEKCYPYRKSPAIYMGLFFSVMALIVIIISNTMNHVVQKSSNKTAGVIGGVELVSSIINPPN